MKEMKRGCKENKGEADEMKKKKGTKETRKLRENASEKGHRTK